MRHAAPSGLGEGTWVRSGGARALGLTATAPAPRSGTSVAPGACAGPNMQGPNLHGIMGQVAGKVRPASATHRSVPCAQQRPFAIAAQRAEVHQGYEDERDHVGQRDHVQLANNSQGCDQGCRTMSKRSQGGGTGVAPAQRPPRCPPAQVGTVLSRLPARMPRYLAPRYEHGLRGL